MKTIEELEIKDFKKKLNPKLFSNWKSSHKLLNKLPIKILLSIGTFYIITNFTTPSTEGQLFDVFDTVVVLVISVAIYFKASLDLKSTQNKLGITEDDIDEARNSDTI